ncbi:MAG: hypothetical protein NTY19_17410, partial [Planctomycetota bacterium]|nr:hypothetical protein [Planctomycetota bacterium]
MSQPTLVQGHVSGLEVGSANPPPLRRSRRRASQRHRLHRSRFLTKLGLEVLEDRRMLSAYYKFDVIGDLLTSGGDTITAIEPEVSVNERGQVAFVGRLNGIQDAVLVGNGNGLPTSISLSGPTLDYSLPQITGGGEVVVRSDLGGLSSVVEFATDLPGVLTRLPVAEGYSSNPGTFTDVKQGLRTESGDVVFVAKSDAAAVPGLYFANFVGNLPVLPDSVTLLQDPNTQPMAANNRSVVFRQQNGATQEIVLVRQSGVSYVSTTLASTNAADPAQLFVSLGAAPGISSDGSIVVFSGDRGHGPGVFAVVNEGSGFGPILRVAGENVVDYNPYDGYSPITNNELGYDAAEQGIYIAAIDSFTRVGVERLGLNGASFDGESFVVTFVGQPSQASIDNPTLPSGAPLLFSNQKGIWSVRVDSQRELQAPQNRVFHPTSPIPVVQLGDTVSGAEVVDFELSDPIAVAAYDPSGATRTVQVGDHYLAFWVGLQPALGPTVSQVIRASHLDTDGDGLLDHWEEPGGGIDIDQDGTVDLDLNAMGASPTHQDLFLEVDWLADQSSHHHEPAPGVTAELVAMFAQAPVSNPDGTMGVKLHLDGGAGTDGTGQPFSQQMGVGPLHGGDQIGMPADPTAHVDVLHFGTAAAVPGVNARAFQDVKQNHFGDGDKWGRELAFHYVVFADSHSFYPSNDAPLTGTTTSATTATLTAAGTPFAGYSSADLRGEVMLITSGPAAGQRNTLAGKTADDQVSFYDTWSVTPDPTSGFVLLSGSSGLAETAFFSSPDNHGLPGSDLLVTLAGFGLNAIPGAGYSVLGNAYTQWRTVAHELGHNLGLRHCGTDPSAAACEATPFTYLSLMSYAHQVAPLLYGSVLSATANTLQANGAPLGVKDYTGYTVEITVGTGLGQTRQVLSNAASSMTLTQPWTTVPDATSRFVLSTNVNNYSQAGDPTFVDWSNLRLDFQ